MKHVWHFFCNYAGIQCQNMNVRNMLVHWWLTKPKNLLYELLLQSTPSVVCWEIWKSSRSKKFDQTPICHNRIISQVGWLVGLILNSQFPSFNSSYKWTKIFDKAERARMQMDITIIKWHNPSPNTLKLNNVGCCKGNPGEAVGGRILRDHKDNMVMPSTLTLVFVAIIKKKSWLC